MIFEGAIVDLQGARRGYLRLRSGRIVEAGLLGTDSSHGRERRLRGIALPRPVNAHTHLGDAAFGREPPPGPVSRLVAPPNGVKFRHLAETEPAVKEAAMRRALQRSAAEGVGAVVDFREEGRAGAELLRRAARGSPVRVVLLGRPVRRPIDPKELSGLLEVADGVGLSSAREEDRAARERVARACRARGRRFALHASEVVRERPEDYLRPRPDLLVHMFRATPDDLAQVASEGIPVAICPRSNALFGHVPDLARLDRAGIDFLLGTDNAMFSAPSMFRELEFAYASQRLLHRAIAPARLVQAAFTRPWVWLGEPERATLDPEDPAPPLLLRLPVDDPEYQVVSRAAEHLIVPTASGAARAWSGR
jgi:cytosine/adenosine deaminase-related metal-dependent hydrolase